MTDNELNLRVAEKVMGWQRWVPPALAPYARLYDPEMFALNSEWRVDPTAPLHPTAVAPPFLSDLTADYSVLTHVVKTWGADARRAYRKYLYGLWNTRTETTDHPEMGYRPGDYSRAALATIGNLGPDTSHIESTPSEGQ